MSKPSIARIIAAAALAGTFGLANAQGSATAVPGTTNNPLSSGAHDTANGNAAAGTHSSDMKKKDRVAAGKAKTMNSNTNPVGTGTKENNGTHAVGAAATSGSTTMGTTKPAGRGDAGTTNSNTNPRGTGTVENNGTQPTTGGTGAVKK